MKRNNFIDLISLCLLIYAAYKLLKSQQNKKQDKKEDNILSN